jgi:uncharacterized protein
MSEHLPAQVDALRLARQGRRLRGRLALGRMSRLKGYLSSAEGQVEADLRFGVDGDGKPYLKGTIEATVELVCQRCLEPMRQPIRARASLGLVGSEAAAERLPEDYDPLIVGDDPLFLSDIVEDELILALPIVPMHDEDGCSAAGATSESAVKSDDSPQPVAENPFAVLRKLKDPTDRK